MNAQETKPETSRIELYVDGKIVLGATVGMKIRPDANVALSLLKDINVCPGLILDDPALI